MTRKPIDYTNTCFYKIVCKDLNITDLYVGHTTDFTKRKNRHRTTCCNPTDKHYNLCVYKFIRDNGGWDNFEMVLIDRQTCIDKLDAERIERHHVEELNATLNGNMPSRSKQEWTEMNKDKIKEQKLNWYNKNKEQLHERARDKYIENKEAIKSKSKAYYEIHKEQLNEKRNVRYTCACGRTLTIRNKSKHEKTDEHKKHIHSLED